MNILFLIPLHEPFDSVVSADRMPWKNKLSGSKKIKRLDCVYPTGVLSIASFLKSRNQTVSIRILDCNVVMKRLSESQESRDSATGSFKEFCLLCQEKLGSFVPDLIGFSVSFCSNYPDLKDLASFWKEIYPSAILLCGGHLAAAIPERIFSDGIPLDAICFGEGELPFLGLVNAVQSGRMKEYLHSAPSWITPEKIRNAQTFRPEREMIEDLDEIPPFDFNMLLFPDAYFHSSSYLFVMKQTSQRKEMFLFSSRGCPYHCIFCASQNIHGHKVRFHSVRRLKEDILYYHQTFGIDRFVFFDDHFLVNRKRAIEILDYIVSLGLTADISTPAFFAIDDEVAAAMYRAGIRETNITVENGNEDTLRNIIHKPANLDLAEKAVRSLHKAGIFVLSNILTGLPGETPASIEKGIAYLSRSEVDWFQSFVVAPLPGSTLYNLCVEKHYLTCDFFSMDFKKCVIHTPDFSPEYIEDKVYEMNLFLNFVHNRAMRNGNYAGALILFERIFTSVIDTHAFAYYFAARCAEKLGDTEKLERYARKSHELTERYPFWKKWMDHFHLSPNNPDREKGQQS